MRCPACERQMEEINMDGVRIDACVGGCGGIWFDRFELKKLDEAHESTGVSLLDIARDLAARRLHDRLRCPRCAQGYVLIRRFFHPSIRVQIDDCPGCAGQWLDAGELGQIRRQAGTEESRQQSARRAYDQMFAEGLAEVRQETLERTEEAKGIARLFRFVLPSWWLPGKQDGGAF